MEQQKIVKDNLKFLIKESGKTANEVIKEAGINRDLYFQYLSVSKRRIPIEWIIKIAKVLNISTDKILLKRLNNV